MNILFLSRWFPYPADNGSKIRVFNLLRQLSKHHTVDLVSFATEDVTTESVDELRCYCRSVVFTSYRPYQPHRLKGILGLFSPRPRSVIDTYDKEMQRLVIQTFKENHPQLVIASQIDMAAYALPLQGVAKIIEEVELASLYEQSSNAATSAQRLRPTLMWMKWVNYMRHLLHQFDGCTVVSSREREILEGFIFPQNQRNGIPPVQIIPNGVALEDYRLGDYDAPIPDTLIFSGALTYLANLDAVTFFIRDIFSEIRQNHPSVELAITGSTEGVSLEGLINQPGVTFLGHLDDIRPAVARSWASVVPLRLGGGTRYKILESLAIGTPVVATRKGAEGLELKDGHDFLLANSASDFAEQTLRLLDDTLLRESLSANGKQTITEYYDWDKIGARLCEFVEQLVTKKD